MHKRKHRMAMLLAILLSTLSFVVPASAGGEQPPKVDEKSTEGAQEVEKKTSPASAETKDDARNQSYFTQIAPRYTEVFAKLKHKNAYTGIAAGRNIIVLQVEGLQNTFLGKEMGGKPMTPFLNGLRERKGVVYVPDYMQMLGYGNSSDAEFVTLHSMYPYHKRPSFEEYATRDLYGLPMIAKDRGYSTIAMHGYTKTFYRRDLAYPHMGFGRVMLGEDYQQDEAIGMGLSDRSFFRQSLPVLRDLAAKGPFFAHMVTLTSHTPFEMPAAYRVLPEGKWKGTMLGNYAQAIHYTDSCIAAFFSGLESAGLLQNTVVAIYGDHFALASSDPKNAQTMQQYLGRPYDFDDMMNIPLLIWVPGLGENVRVEVTGSQLDFLPTLLNLMGWNDVVAPIFGVDLLDASAKDNAVFQQTHMLKGSFLTKDTLFEMNRSFDLSKSRVLDRKTRTPKDITAYYETVRRAHRMIDLSQGMLYLNRVTPLRIAHAKGVETILKSEYAIAHAGGELDSMTYTNMADTLDANYALGKRYFEVDIERTSDDVPVCLHSWDGFVFKYFRRETGGVPMPYAEFQKLEEVHGYRSMDVLALVDWFKAHPDAYLITDAKTKNLDTLRRISRYAPEILPRVMPQMYHREEYDAIRKLGLSNIVYTLYMSPDTDDEIVGFATSHNIYAVAMDLEKFRTGLGKRLIDSGVRVFVHTVNDAAVAKALLDMGVQKVYTDSL